MHARVKIYALCASSNNPRKRDPRSLACPSRHFHLRARAPLYASQREFIRGMIGERGESHAASH